MIRTLLVIGALAYSFTACNAQETSNQQHAPKIDSKVTKHYDDKGNLIGYDSSYTEYYSNIEGNGLMLDSLFNHIRQQFANQHQMFNSWNQTDSLFLKQFDAFQFDEQFNAMNRFMREVDSLQNNLMRKHLYNKSTQPTSTKPGITM